MHLRINMETLSRLLDQDFSSLRGQFHLGRFGDVGKLPKRRDRTFGFAEFSLLKLAHALRDRDPRSIAKAWQIAGGFADHLVHEIARATGELRSFALVVRSAAGDQCVVCHGDDELREAVGTFATTGGPMVDLTVLDLSMLAEEITTEWALATGRGSELRELFFERADQMTDEERGRMASVLSRAQKKLEDGTMVIVINDAMALPGEPEPMAPLPKAVTPKVRA